MNTKDRTIATLEQLFLFFLSHNIPGWASRSERALHAIREENADLKRVLHDYIGTGMGSLIDLYVCSDNGHTLQTTEEDANKQLSNLTEQILTIKTALDHK